jgi:hypothetical protein
MFRAKLIKQLNLLHVRYTGRVGPADTETYAKHLPPLLAQLTPGFRLLTDMSALDEIQLECVPHIKAMMDLCNQRGVAMVVRVIPDPHKDVGMNILSPFHYRRDVHIVTCETIDEALALLGD